MKTDNRQFLLLILICLFSSCCQYKAFNRFDVDGIKEVVVGHKSNKLFERDTLNDPTLDPNVLTTSYRTQIKNILLRYLNDHYDYHQLNSEQSFYITLYFDPKDYSVIEVYFTEINGGVAALFKNNILLKIEHDIKQEIFASPNERLINRSLDQQRLSNSKYVPHIIGFRTKQLFELKNREISSEDVLDL